MNRTMHRAAAGLLAGAALISLAACSSSSGSSAAPTTSTAATTGTPGEASTLAATRWWSDAAGGVGSAIDVSDPTADAGKVTPSQATYCGILTSTVKAGGSSGLAVMKSRNAASLATLKAFVAETEASAPATVSAAWKTLGGALLQLADGGTKTAATSQSSADVSTAAQTIISDAETSCGLTAAQLTGGLSGSSASSTGK